MSLKFPIIKVRGWKGEHKTLAKFYWHSPEETNLFLPSSGPIDLGATDAEGWWQVWAQTKLRKVPGR